MEAPAKLKRKIFEAKAVVARFEKGRQTDADKKLIDEHAQTGNHSSWVAVARSFLEKTEAEHKANLAGFFDGGGMLPFVDGHAAAPLKILRSSLFAPIANGTRKTFKEHHLVAEFAGGQVLYRGDQLDQQDFTLMLELTRLLSQQTEEETVTFREGGGYSIISIPRYSLLTRLGNNRPSSKEYSALDKSLLRLATGDLKVTVAGVGVYSGSLVGRRFLDDATDWINIEINQDYLSLFKDGGFSYIEADKRQKLKSKFAKWLCGFVSTHSGERTMSAETLMQKCGSTAKITTVWASRTCEPGFQELLDKNIIKYYNCDKKKKFFTWKR